MSYRIGVDIGGTFTDLILVDDAGAVFQVAKVLTTPAEPARAVEVDLGTKGVWFRVVIGQFRTADEARAFRAALAAKKTPGMGFVYEMKGAR